MPDAMECPAVQNSAGTPIRGITREWVPRAATPNAAINPHAPLLERILQARGLADSQESARFLEPSLRHLHDPSLIPDLDRAADRLLRAAAAGEPIVIYGDYDVDGVTATAILYHTLLTLHPSAGVSTYVPHRLEEGYGLNTGAISELAARGAKVIVSVDCGVTALAPALAAREAGVDLVITDHHNPPAREEDLPRAYAVVHPRRPGSTYPFGDLCGAGVAYKLAWRLATLACGSQRVAEPIRVLLLELLALAALGVIADVVPLTDENRVIARFGLARIKHSTIPGLRALVEAAGLAGENVKEEDVGFTLAPRLNACGRMGHAREAVELLTTADRARAAEIAQRLTRLNDERRATERAIFERAVELAQLAGMTEPNCRAIVLADPSWHAGVVGIVCSRLVERFHRPAILMCRGDDGCHGSGRSVDGFSLHAALSECAGHLVQFGGHDMAAGLRLESDRLADFVRDFTHVANRCIPPERLIGRAGFDADAQIRELSLDVVRRLEHLGPFGRENPSVRVRMQGLRVAMRPETFGRNNAHLSLRVVQEPGVNAPVMRLFGWSWGERASKFPPGACIDALVTPRISTFRAPCVECEIADIRVC